MKVLIDKFKEVSLSVLPITVIVIILNFTIAPLGANLISRFLIGAVMIIIGLGIFLLGVDLGIERIGALMGEGVGKSKKVYKVLLIGLILGFLITVAEPDLLILANQVTKAMGGALQPFNIIVVVALGVGVMIAIGFLRILLDIKTSHLFLILYGGILIIFFFVSEEFQAIAFDASGATTGALTTPFILSMGIGVSKMKGSNKGKDASFGLAGIASVGPIYAIMIMSLIMGADKIQGTADKFVPATGIIDPIIHEFLPVVKESIVVLIPVTVLFIMTNIFVFKLGKRELHKIYVGLIYTLIGLIIFMIGVNAGFMDVARILGEKLASLDSKALLPSFGLILGMVVVLAEPAVYVLSDQVEEVTGGSIPKRLILISLSIGVAISVSLALLRIMIPELKIWMILVPGFIIVLVMSFLVPEIFVGIAFDSGGVASGTMTATFVLAFTQGVAEIIPTADVLRDGFGVMAIVAMIPIIAILTLGVLFNIKTKRIQKNIEKESLMERKVN